MVSFVSNYTKRMVGGSTTTGAIQKTLYGILWHFVAVYGAQLESVESPDSSAHTSRLKQLRLVRFDIAFDLFTRS